LSQTFSYLILYSNLAHRSADLKDIAIYLKKLNYFNYSIFKSQKSQSGLTQKPGFSTKNLDLSRSIQVRNPV